MNVADEVTNDSKMIRDEGAADHVFISRTEPAEVPGDGLRLAVKDCIDVAGFRTTAGALAVADDAPIAEHDAACLAGARAAGAVIVGKTNLHELCFGATGVNPHFGTPRNPLDPGRIPGGSSSGSAVAVALGEADVAYGTDTAGSIRNPAACCGVVGLKTTWGRIDPTGTRALAPSMDTIGPLARDVNGVGAGMAMLEPGFVPAATADGSAVRCARLLADGVDPRIEESVGHALGLFTEQVTSLALPGWRRAYDDGRALMFVEALETNATLWPERRALLGDDVARRFIEAEEIPLVRARRLRSGREQWHEELGRALASFDVLITAGYPSFPARLVDADPASSVVAVAVSYAGFPALCLPIPSLDGPTTPTGERFPASMQLVGLPGTEDNLLGIARGIEAALRHPNS